MQRKFFATLDFMKFYKQQSSGEITKEKIPYIYIWVCVEFFIYIYIYIYIFIDFYFEMYSEFKRF